MELDLAIVQFLKANALGVEEMLRLLGEEYRLRFGRPALMDSRLHRDSPMELIWAMERALEAGDPDYGAYLYRGTREA